MFVFALIVGVYSYLIFFMGLAGWLYKDTVVEVTLVFWATVLLSYWRRMPRSPLASWGRLAMTKVWKKNKLVLFFGLLLGLQAIVNLIGALGPELAFDALWYHLTLPKLYLENHSVYFIPGGLLYYSAMPKLAEMLYVGGLSLGNEITVKLIHYSFGLLTCFALYKLSRKFFTPLISLIAVVIFYANLVVAWESITAYIDLVRAFFEVMALWAFLNWNETKMRKWLIMSALMIGFAIATKVLAIGSLMIFSILLLAVGGWQLEKSKSNLLSAIRNVIVYWFIALTTALPWFIFSYINTGNPVYPFFTSTYHVAPEPISLIGFFREVWNVFMYSPDPISPVYMMLLPLGVWLLYRSRNPSVSLRAGKFRMINGLSMVGLYSLFVIVVWYFTPRTGGGRFLLPYLPAFSLLCAAVLHEVLQNKKQYGAYVGKFLLVIIIGVSLISIGYRFVANKKYIPVIVGKETKDVFLTNNLNFAFADFYDTDGYFKKNIKPTDMVLLYGFHNLYYIDFPFIDNTWLQKDDEFNYIATQKTDLPPEFGDWVLVYENEQTMVKLYQKPERLYTHK